MKLFILFLKKLLAQYKVQNSSQQKCSQFQNLCRKSITKKKHWNHLTKNRIDVISICFSIFNFCSTCKLSSVIFESVPYFSVCSFQEQCCQQFPAWSKHNLLTWLLPDPKLWQTYFLPFRFFSCILFVVYSCYHNGSMHCSSRKIFCTTDFYKYQQHHITKYQLLLP